MIEDSRAAPGRRRTLARGARGGSYVSIVALLDELAARGVELRLLHAELPSRPFRAELAQRPRLVAGALALARCPRVHLKAVIVDGELLYLGSANWSGAGLGAKGSGRRNFELGVVTDDTELLDRVQAMYERIFSGGECAACKLRQECPGPLSELRTSRSAQPGAKAAATVAASAAAPAPPATRATRGVPPAAAEATMAAAPGSPVRARGASASRRRAPGTDRSTAPRRA
jgi:hypothetical protein